MNDDRLDMNAIQQLMIDKLTDQLSPVDEQTLASLLEKDASLRQQWTQLQQVYAISRAAKFEKEYNAEASWKALQERTARAATQSAATSMVSGTISIAGQGRETAPVIPIRRRTWLRYAAAVVLLAAVAIPAYRYFKPAGNIEPITGTVVRLKLPNGNMIDMPVNQVAVNESAPVVQDLQGKAVVDAATSNIDPDAMNALSVPSGKTFEMKLADGTQVWMNAASNLDFPLRFSRSTREVTLTGEAYFKVAHNPNQPFIVNVNGMKVEVLGTEFNVKAYPGEKQQAALVKGKVAVRNRLGQQVMIEPGQQAMISSGSDNINVSSFDETIVLGWMNGMYYFRDEELKDIIQIIQRWFDVRIRFEDPALAQLHFTGALNKNKPLTDFLDILGKTSGTRYTINENQVTFSR